MRRFLIYRYDPESDAPPRMQVYDFEARDDERMRLGALIRLKAIDPGLSFAVRAAKACAATTR